MVLYVCFMDLMRNMKEYISILIKHLFWRSCCLYITQILVNISLVKLDYYIWFNFFDWFYSAHCVHFSCVHICFFIMKEYEDKHIRANHKSDQKEKVYHQLRVYPWNILNPLTHLHDFIYVLIILFEDQYSGNYEPLNHH